MNSANSDQISVLLVDDDEDDFLIIKSVFSRIPDSPFILEWCSSYKKAKKFIKSHDFDIYMIDYHLGEFNGLDLLKYAEPQKRPEPFILLTGTGDREVERQSMKLAAADYLVKGTFGPELLSRTLYYSLGRKQIEEQRLESLIELNRTKDEFISLASHQLRARGICR
jgi:two-component system cell cycle sensor histidine kinase/response regulator CckA